MVVAEVDGIDGVERGQLCQHLLSRLTNAADLLLKSEDFFFHGSIVGPQFERVYSTFFVVPGGAYGRC